MGYVFSNGAFVFGALNTKWYAKVIADQVKREDIALRVLAENYSIDATQADWLRTLALCLAVEHVKGFHKSVGGGLLSINQTILSSKAWIKVANPRGRPSKKFNQDLREDAVLTAASEVQSRFPKLSLRAACIALHKKRFVLSGDKKPLSMKRLYGFAVRAKGRKQRASAKSMGDGPGLIETLLSGAIDTGSSSPKKSE